nr:hypothetical protein [Tanacetum cinerariifolium]
MIEQQVALDEALVPSTKRLRIGRSNFRLPLDIQSKESTLQVVYDVLRQSPFFKAFLMTADVPKIYMQEFWATAYAHQHSIRFKMDTRKNIVDLESFREMLHITLEIICCSYKQVPDWKKYWLRQSQNTQQYGAIQPIKLTTEDIRNTKAYKEYYACATGVAAPKPKASARKKKEEAEKVNDDDDDEEEIAKIDEQEATESGGEDEETEIDRESEEDETTKKEEESFDPIPKTPEESMKCIFKTGSSTITPIPSPKYTMTPSIMKTTTTASQPPIPPTPIPSIDLQNLPTFASVFRFKDRVKSLEVNFSEFMRTNQSTEATDQLQDSLQRENDEFLITIDDNIKKIIKERVKNQAMAQVTRILPRIKEFVNAHLEAEVLTRSSHSSRTSYAVAADLSEMELKKILIDKMEGNKREDDDDQEGPSAGSDRGPKRRREGGEHASASTPSESASGSAGMSTTGSQSRQLSASESAFAEEPVQTTCQMEEPSHPVFETGAEDPPIVQTSQHPEWFSQLRKPPTTDRDWNKSLPAAQGNAQSWISALAKQTDARSSFNELQDTPIDFSNFIMKRLGVDTLTPKLLAGPTYELMRGLCNSLTELEYHLEEVYKATTDQLDWVNPKGQQYPHNLLQPLPLIPDNRGRRVIPFEHFINNDLEYLRGGASSKKYTTSVTKTKAADYGHIKWIEDLVPRTMWIREPINYDKHALWGFSHRGQKRQQFYGFAVNR